VTLKSYVILKGEVQSDGWAALPSYPAGSVLKLKNSANTDLVGVESTSYNWGLVDMVLDGNKTNQTTAGLHLLSHYNTSGSKSAGGLISGCKFVNASDWSLYLVNAQPLNISNNAINDGLYVGVSSDTLISNNSIGGTTNEHPAVWMNDINANVVSDNFIWRAEAASARISQTVTVNTTDNYLVCSDGTKFYDGMPVNFKTAGTYPTMAINSGTNTIRGNAPLVVKVASGNNLEVYYADKDNTNARVSFSTTGSGTHTLTGGPDVVIFANTGSRNRFLGNRVAGSPAGATYLYNTDGNQYCNNQHWGLNWNEDAQVAALYLLGSEKNIISDNVVGEYPTSGVAADNIDYAVLLHDFNNNSMVKYTRYNVMSDNVYDASDGRFVKDDTTSVYAQRNVISGLGNVFTGGRTKRIESPTYYSEPTRFYYYALPAEALTVLASDATDVPWTAEGSIGNPAGLTNPDTEGDLLTLTDTKESLLDIKGQLGFDSRPDEDFYVLIYVVVNDGIAVNHRVYEEFYASGGEPGVIIVPFNLQRTIETSDATLKITVYQTSGGPLTLNTGQDYSYLSVSKVADYHP
jgi:hypothetical protein